VPLVTRIVAVMDWLPVDEQVAPVMPPLDELLLDDVLLDEVELDEVDELEVELELELEDPEFEYEQ
jgi:hypothetical protein